MTEILSAQELDALLARPEVAGATAPNAGGGIAAARFSFDAPPPLTGSRAEKTESVAARLAEELQRRLAADLRRSIVVGGAATETLGRTGALHLLQGAVGLEFADAGGKTIATLVLDLEVALALVEARLGGATGESQPKRPLTAVESLLLARLWKGSGGPAVLSCAAALFGEAPTGPLHCASIDESRLRGSGFVAISFQLTADGRGGRARLLLPAARLARAAATAAPSAKRGVVVSPGTLLRLPVRIVPRIPGGAIRLADLTELSPGQVVRLDHPHDRPIDVACNQETVLRARLVRAGERTALEITGWVEPDPVSESEER